MASSWLKALLQVRNILVQIRSYQVASVSISRETNICAAVFLPDVEWESVGATFRNCLLFRLDPFVVRSISFGDEKCENNALPSNDNILNESYNLPSISSESNGNHD